MTSFISSATIEAARLRSDALQRLVAFIEGHIAAGHYSGAQVAIGRNGKLAFNRSFGEAAPDLPTDDRTLFLLYSNTKVLTASVVWALVERGLLAFSDRVADHVPEFARHGKGDVTVLHLLTHQAGFPDTHPDLDIPRAAYRDHALLREAVCDFKLQWEPGSKVVYHYNAAHWAVAVLVEAVTGQDFRDVMRQLIFEPLGVERELLIGLPERDPPRNVAALYEPVDGALRRHPDDNVDRQRAGVPAGGAFGTARAMTCFYQALLGGGAIDGRRIFGPQTLRFVLRGVTGEQCVENLGKVMQFAVGPHVRGSTFPSRELGSAASPRAFGHTGVGSSLCWGDPETGVSLAYLTNTRSPDPWHSRRLELINQVVQSAIL